MCKALRERGIREGLVQRCENLLKETRNRIRIRGKSSEVFWTGRGVKQGCLSPGLFNILTTELEEVMKKGGWVRLKEEKCIH